MIMDNLSSDVYVVVIDTDRCQGHSRCAMLAPDVFTSDVYGFGCVRCDGVVSGDQLANVELAIANCPESAIVITRSDNM